MNRKQLAERNLFVNGLSIREFQIEPFKYPVHINNSSLINEQRHNLIDRGFTLDAFDDGEVYWVSSTEFTAEPEEDRDRRIEQARQHNLERIEYLERGGMKNIREDYEYLKSLCSSVGGI